MLQLAKLSKDKASCLVTKAWRVLEKVLSRSFPADSAQISRFVSSLGEKVETYIDDNLCQEGLNLFVKSVLAKMSKPNERYRVGEASFPSIGQSKAARSAVYPVGFNVLLAKILIPIERADPKQRAHVREQGKVHRRASAHAEWPRRERVRYGQLAGAPPAARVPVCSICNGAASSRATRGLPPKTTTLPTSSQEEISRRRSSTLEIAAWRWYDARSTLLTASCRRWRRERRRRRRGRARHRPNRLDEHDGPYEA